MRKQTWCRALVAAVALCAVRAQAISWTQGTSFGHMGTAGSSQRISTLTSGWYYDNNGNNKYADGTVPGSSSYVYLRAAQNKSTTFTIEEGDALAYTEFLVGAGWGAYTTCNITGGSLTLSGYFKVGYWTDGHGTVNMSGGQVTANRIQMGVERACKDAKFNLSGGTLNLTINNNYCHWEIILVP